MATVSPLLKRQQTLPSLSTRVNSDELRQFIPSALRRRGPSTQDQVEPLVTSAQPSSNIPPQDWHDKLNPIEVLEAAWFQKADEFEEKILPGDQEDPCEGRKHVQLPQFDAVGQYGFEDSRAKQLLLAEIRRLVRVVQEHRDPLTFSDDKYFKTVEASPEGYQRLDHLARKIMCATNICSLDNECLVLKHGNRSGRLDKNKLSRNLQSLKKYVQAQAGTMNDEVPSSSSCPDPDQEKAASYNLIDYMSALLARLLIESASGDHWQHNLLGVLATWTTKCKILLLDLETNASISVMYAEADIAANPEMPNLFGDSKKDDDFDPCEMEDFKESVDAPTENAHAAAHCMKQSVYRMNLDKLWDYLLLSLTPSSRSGFAINAYEVCSVVYETGLEGFQVLLFQDKDFEFLATSQARNLEIAHSAYHILNQTVQHLDKNKTIPPPPREEDYAKKTKPTPKPLVTELDWHYFDPSQSQNDSTQVKATTSHLLTLGKMADVVSVTVALTATSPVVASRILILRNCVSITGAIQDINTVRPRPHEYRNFNAAFRLYTSEFPVYVDGDVSSMAGAIKQELFSRDFLLSGEPNTGGAQKAIPASSSSDGLIIASTQNLQSIKYERNANELAKLSSEMAEWVYDEGSVCVSCALYVWSVMGAAALMVVGGLAVGFTLGTRIHGVDPFNITTYVWVLAAFLIVVCKSLRVENWPWRDFFLGRVRCRSVSELQGVTGYNDKLIIAKLLHDEFEGILNTCGPYNSIFKRNAGAGAGGGFAIDRSLDTRTLLLSGLIMLKVATPDGHGLVCLDARRGSGMQAITHKNIGGRNDTLIVCNDIDTQLCHKGVNKLRLPLRNDSLQWIKVLGIYRNLDAMFV